MGDGDGQRDAVSLGLIILVMFMSHPLCHIGHITFILCTILDVLVSHCVSY